MTGLDLHRSIIDAGYTIPTILVSLPGLNDIIHFRHNQTVFVFAVPRKPG